VLTLLQAGRPPMGAGGGGANAPDPAYFMLILALYFGVIVIAIAIQIFFLISLSNCWKEISEKNRQMSPGQVWLCLIPVFGLIWLILLIIRLADSLKDEYDDRGLRHEGDFGKTLGIIYVVSGFICGCVTPIVWIMYWLKVNSFTRELREAGGSTKKKRRTDDDDDRSFRDE
jgi:nitric oxide reductase large subunit